MEVYNDFSEAPLNRVGCKWLSPRPRDVTGLRFPMVAETTKRRKRGGVSTDATVA